MAWHLMTLCYPDDTGLRAIGHDQGKLYACMVLEIRADLICIAASSRSEDGEADVIRG